MIHMLALKNPKKIKFSRKDAKLAKNCEYIAIKVIQFFTLRLGVSV
jgi:hypothetical protein